MPGFQRHEPLQLAPVLGLPQLADRHLPELLRLLPAALLHPGERPQLCLLQAQHGPQVGHALPGPHGLPVHLRHPPGRQLRYTHPSSSLFSIFFY